MSPQATSWFYAWRWCRAEALGLTVYLGIRPSCLDRSCVIGLVMRLCCCSGHGYTVSLTSSSVNHLQTMVYRLRPWRVRAQVTSTLSLLHPVAVELRIFTVISHYGQQKWCKSNKSQTTSRWTEDWLKCVVHSLAAACRAPLSPYVSCAFVRRLHRPQTLGGSDMPIIRSSN